jgi:hypothetical protein
LLLLVLLLLLLLIWTGVQVHIRLKTVQVLLGPVNGLAVDCIVLVKGQGRAWICFVKAAMCLCCQQCISLASSCSTVRQVQHHTKTLYFQC